MLIKHCLGIRFSTVNKREKIPLRLLLTKDEDDDKQTKYQVVISGLKEIKQSGEMLAGVGGG